MRTFIFALASLTLVGCYEPASTWDEKSGRYRSTADMKQEQRMRDREIERRLERLEAAPSR